jgi:hypothetical protein
MAVGKETVLTGEVLDRFSQLITTALGLVAALAWNTAIQNLFDRILGKAGPRWPDSSSSPSS